MIPKQDVDQSIKFCPVCGRKLKGSGIGGTEDGLPAEFLHCVAGGHSWEVADDVRESGFQQIKRGSRPQKARNKR